MYTGTNHLQNAGLDEFGPAEVHLVYAKPDKTGRVFLSEKVERFGSIIEAAQFIRDIPGSDPWVRRAKLICDVQPIEYVVDEEPDLWLN